MMVSFPLTLHQNHTIFSLYLAAAAPYFVQVQANQKSIIIIRM